MLGTTQFIILHTSITMAIIPYGWIGCWEPFVTLRMIHARKRRRCSRHACSIWIPIISINKLCHRSVIFSPSSLCLCLYSNGETSAAAMKWWGGWFYAVKFVLQAVAQFDISFLLFPNVYEIRTLSFLWDQKKKERGICTWLICSRLKPNQRAKELRDHSQHRHTGKKKKEKERVEGSSDTAW